MALTQFKWWVVLRWMSYFEISKLLPIIFCTIELPFGEMKRSKRCLSLNKNRFQAFYFLVQIELSKLDFIQNCRRSTFVHNSNNNVREYSITISNTLVKTTTLWSTLKKSLERSNKSPNFQESTGLLWLITVRLMCFNTTNNCHSWCWCITKMFIWGTE